MDPGLCSWMTQLYSAFPEFPRISLSQHGPRALMQLGWMEISFSHNANVVCGKPLFQLLWAKAYLSWTCMERCSLRDGETVNITVANSLPL